MDVTEPDRSWLSAWGDSDGRFAQKTTIQFDYIWCTKKLAMFVKRTGTNIISLSKLQVIDWISMSKVTRSVFKQF